MPSPAADVARTTPRSRPRVRGWAVASAVAAPVGMIGGWTLAAVLQRGFDPVRETISELATAAVELPG
jgi:zinc transporter ZupT